jgi:hypothetical protein
MKCVIMQPTYLSWSGYFNLISNADVFIFLDDVQYEKSSWQNRNRILLNGKPHWITASALKGSLSQLICQTKTEDKHNWRKKNYKLLESTYRKHPYGKDMLEIVDLILDESLNYLAELNISLIMRFCEKLNIKTSFYKSSELNVTGQRSDRLLKFCQHFGCDEYLSPIGSAEYLKEDGVFDNAPVKLSFQEYTPRFYEQKGATEFVSHLSIVDVVANLGWEQATEYVRHGQVESGQIVI